MIEVDMKTFETYEYVHNLQPCMKRPIVVHAKQIHEEFRVNTLEGNYKQGKAGDYLMMGIDAELYICDKAIFEKTYDFTDTDNSKAWTPWGHL
jgi:hypothetical protein